MRTLDQRASNIIASIEACPTKPSCLVTDGNHLIPFVATMAYAKKHNIPVIGTENSFLTNVFYMDKYGGISNEMLEMKELWKQRQTDVKENVQLVDSVLASKSRGQVTHPLEYDFKPGPHYDPSKKTVLCLGQVDCDSVICRDIGEFKNLDDFFSSVQSAVGDKYNLIVRLHPWDAKFHDNITYRYFSKLARPETMIFKALEANTYALIDRVADVVITLTSQCGLETAVAGKPVVTCGNAFYNAGGFAIETNKDTIAYAIDIAMTTDRELIRRRARKFLSFMMEEYMVDMTGKKDTLIMYKINSALNRENK
jgi:capsule polysaccharide export protein KpsC/LpsZ